MKIPDWKAYIETIKVPGNARVWALGGVCLLMLLLAVIVMRATGIDSGGNGDGLPAPGTMRLVLVERVEDRARAEARKNLLPGGDFRTWWAGAPSPQGVIAPDPGASRLQRGEGLSQIWQRPEGPGSIDPRMRLESGNLLPGTYELETLASGVVGGAVAIGLWTKTINEKPAPLDDDFITILPGDGQAKRYTRRFMLEKPGAVLITSHALFGMLPDSKIVWHAMRLTRVGGKG